MADGRVIIEAILDTANVAKNVKGLGKELNGISWKNIKEGDEKAQALSGAFKSAGTACTLSLTAPVAAAGAAAFGVASDYGKATSSIQAALGLTREEAERFKDIGADVYENGWGESMDDVTQALVTVKENFKDLDGVELQSVTESALMLRDTFDMDVSESIRGAENMATAFGISAEDSMDLLTVAAQNGLNSTDELGDNLAEYATLFQENGYSAEEMFATLQAGLDAGAYNLDKVNDLVKEFGIRMSDGSVATACEELGGNFKTIYDEAQAAGKSNKETFELLAGEIKNCGSEQEKAAAISAIFGSQGEDNGIKVIEAMADVTGAYGDVSGAAKAAGDAASDNFGTQMETAIRKVQGALEPLGEPLVNIATKVAEVVQSFGEWFAGIGENGQMAVLAIGGILAAIGPVLSVAGHLVNVIPAIAGAFGGAGTAAGAAGAGTGLFGGALSALAGPVGIAIAAIAAVVGILVHLWNTNEGFRNAVIEAWNSIQGSIQEIMDALAPYIQAAWDGIVAVVVPLVEGIANAVGIAFTTILNVISSIMEAVSGVISGAMQVVQGIFETVCGFIHGVVTGDFSAMSEGVGSILDGLSGIVSSIWNGISDAVGSVIDGIGDLVANGWNTVCDVTGSLFGSAADSIGDIMGDAENTVSGALDAIAGFFSGLKIEWPHIPLPHFEISGSFNLDPANFSVPSLGINWYAKGGVFNGPSVIGVGEAGPEAVVPLRGERMRPFAEEVAKNMPEGDTGGSITINIGTFVHSGSEADDEKLLRRVAQKVKTRKRAGGFA